MMAIPRQLPRLSKGWLYREILLLPVGWELRSSTLSPILPLPAGILQQQQLNMFKLNRYPQNLRQNKPKLSPPLSALTHALLHMS